MRAIGPCVPALAFVAERAIVPVTQRPPKSAKAHIGCALRPVRSWSDDGRLAIIVTDGQTNQAGRQTASENPSLCERPSNV